MGNNEHELPLLSCEDSDDEPFPLIHSDDEDDGRTKQETDEEDSED